MKTWREQELVVPSFLSRFLGQNILFHCLRSETERTVCNRRVEVKGKREEECLAEEDITPNSADLFAFPPLFLFS